MTIRVRALWVTMIGCLWACTAPSPQSRVDPTDPAAAEAPAPPVEAMIPPTLAQLQAGLSGDPQAMIDAMIAEGTCHASSTCPQPASCANWSPTTTCDFTCGPIECVCKPTNPDCAPGDLRGRTTQNRFRVCHYPDGSSCTEWQQTLILSCGC